MSASRKPIPKDVETRVLVACRRRCCLCWHLNRDDGEKSGQIAHVDRDSANNAEDNLVWLCLPHHEKYDRTSRQAKGLTKAELRHAREDLWQHVRQPAAPPAAPLQAPVASVFNQTNQHVVHQINIVGDTVLTVHTSTSPPASGASKAELGTKAAAKAKSEAALHAPEAQPPLSMNGLTWLHLSDWHQKGRDFNRSVMRDALLKDLRQRADIDLSLHEVDFVVFSGDVAFQGKAEEFESARRELFDPVLEILGLTPDKLFIVPGNHDLSRDHVNEMLPEALQSPFTKEEDVQKWLTDEKRRDRALEPFEEFTRFVSGYTGQKPAAYANTWTGFIGNQTVGIVCLNSSWMCGRNKGAKGEVNDYGYLTLGEPQLHEALSAIQGADLRLAVLHHPFPWLASFDCNRVEERLKRECHFILHGHEHVPNFNLGHGLSGQCAVIPAGACYDRRTAADPRYSNAYNFVRLDFESGRGVIFLRRWSDRRNAWIEDTDSHEGGKYPFALPKELGRPRAAIAKPALPTASPGRPAESSAIVAYRERLMESVSKLPLIGLGHILKIELPISQAYIPLNVAITRSLRKVAVGAFDEKLLRQNDHFDADVRLCDVFKRAGREGDRGVLLLGDPGAGKTTGARQFCWRVLTEADLPKSLGLPAGTVPVFLRLRNVTPQHLVQGLAAFITEGVAAPTQAAGLAQPGPDLLAREGVLWIFDGLDEVVSEQARVTVCEWIRQALGDRPRDWFLVTSRYQGYQGDVDLGPAFCEFHVRPLDAEQVAEFVACWYRTVYGRLHGDDPAKLAEADAEVASLVTMLAEPAYRIGHLRELPANPLMLTILCLVHHQDHNLPRRRADLYARCVRVLLEHWTKERQVAQGVAAYDAAAAEGVLANVAWSLHGEDKRITLTVEELGKEAALALAELSPSACLGRDGEAFIRRMRDENGVLAMWSAGQCGFLHLSFQEYLAGLHAAREGKVYELVKEIGKSWWREVILVAVALGSRDFALKFFSALLQTDAVEKEASFVDQCLDESRFAVVEPFIDVLKRAAQNPQRQFDILRRLRHSQHEDLTEICRDLARSANSELAALAREILQRAGVVVETPTEVVMGNPFDESVDPRSGIAFINIPAGEFLMGSNDGFDDETPVHPVRITRPFRLGKYPITNAEYQRFLEADPNAIPPQYWNNSRFNKPQQPVVGVSWDDAQAFCEWAGGRLPTEAEWEYACRAGSRTRYSFGDEEQRLAEYAWYLENGRYSTQPVGRKQPNAWGLYDMTGNVWEWCRDGKRVYTGGLQADPVGPIEETFSRVVRGGSWSFQAWGCSAAYRHLYGQAARGNYLGFRLAADQEPGRGVP